MLLSVKDLFERITDGLTSYFDEHEYSGCSYRTPAGDAGALAESTPSVYAYLCPPSEMNSIAPNMPSALPSVTVVLNSQTIEDDNRDFSVCSVTFHCCTYNPSYKIAFNPVEGSDGFEANEDDDYNESSNGFEVDLYKSCLDLQTAVIDYLNQQTEFSLLEEPALTPASPALDDFPAIVGTVQTSIRLFDGAVRYPRAVASLL